MPACSSRSTTWRSWRSRPARCSWTASTAPPPGPSSSTSGPRPPPWPWPSCASSAGPWPGCIAADPAGGIRITNLHTFRDLAHLRFDWSLESEVVAVATGRLQVPSLGPGDSTTAPLPDLPPTSPETWLTVRALLATAHPLAPSGHEIAWGQLLVTPPRPAAALPPPPPSPPDTPEPHPPTSGPPVGEATPASRTTTPRITLGPGVFDGGDGRLRRLGNLEVEGPRLDLWRAPTDNDEGYHGEVALAPVWRRVGLDRLEYRVDRAAVEDDGLVVHARVAPAGTDLGVAATYRWSAVPGGLRLVLVVVPEGAWPCPLPRIGLRMAVPAGLRLVEWFGRGPGEAYADTGRAARVGRFAASVEELQTPYLYPQENGNRAGVRWATLGTAGGTGSGSRASRPSTSPSGPGPASSSTGPGIPPTCVPTAASGSTSTWPSRGSDRPPAAPGSCPPTGSTRPRRASRCGCTRVRLARRGDDGDGQAADPDLLLAAVDGVALAGHGVELGQEPAQVGDGPSGAPGEAHAGQQRLHLGPGPEGEHDLAHRARVGEDAPAHLGEHPHPVLARGHLGDVGDLAVLEHGQVGRLAAGLHQLGQVGAGEPAEVPGRGLAQPDQVGAERVLVRGRVLAHVAPAGHGGEQPVDGGHGQAGGPPQLADASRLAWVGERLQQLQGPLHGLDPVVTALGLGGRPRLAGADHVAPLCGRSHGTAVYAEYLPYGRINFSSCGRVGAGSVKGARDGRHPRAEPVWQGRDAHGPRHQGRGPSRAQGPQRRGHPVRRHDRRPPDRRQRQRRPDRHPEEHRLRLCQGRAGRRDRGVRAAPGPPHL